MIMLEFGIELKRYKIRQGGWDEFYAIWNRIVVTRKRHGFTVMFALEDRKNSMFTWAISNDDFEGASERYYNDPERIELRVVQDWVVEWDITRVDRVPII